MRSNHYREIITIALHVKGLAELQCFICSDTVSADHVRCSLQSDSDYQA
jgi:hypothetical protein